MLISGYLVTAVVFGFIALSPETRHWFVAPLMLCAFLTGADGVDWLRGRVDLFDPAGLIGFLGFHQFFLAPLLHVHLDYWMSEALAPDDWRPWIGGMAALNAAGLVCYRLARNWVGSQRRWAGPSDHRVEWRLRRRGFFALTAGVLPLSVAAQLAVYRGFGGISGYIETFASADDAFRDLGIALLFSETFPILAFIATVEAFRDRSRHPWALLLGLLLGFLILQFLAGGLKGSRSATIYGLFWAACIVHLVLRRIPRVLATLAITFLVCFMYLYSFYKGAGTDVVGLLRGETTVAELEEETGRDMTGLLLGDLARSDVQAFVLYRMSTGNPDYALGRTYVGAVALMVPRSVWPDRPPTKTKEGTEVFFGSGMYVPGLPRSSRVFGLSGEGMLNFGPACIPLLFTLLGAWTGFLRGFRWRLSGNDARVYLYPMMVLATVAAVTSDSDNLVFMLVKNLSVPGVILFLSSARRHRGGYAA